MNKKIYSIIGVAALLLLGLLFSTIYYRQLQSQNSSLLRAAKLRVSSDSLVIADQLLFQRKLKQIMASHFSEEDTTLLQEDRLLELLEGYLTETELRAAETGQAVSRLSLEADSFKNNAAQLAGSKLELAKELEMAEFQVAALEKSMRSLSAAYGDMADSLSRQLAVVQLQLNEASIDTLRLPSPKGVTLTYYGKSQNNVPQGFGIGFYEGRGYYIGNWMGANRHGFGRHFYKNGDRYEGFFENDLRVGYGQYYYASGEVYKGEWKQDLMDGKGELINKEGKSFTGIWAKGKRAASSGQ